MSPLHSFISMSGLAMYLTQQTYLAQFTLFEILAKVQDKPCFVLPVVLFGDDLAK